MIRLFGEAAVLVEVDGPEEARAACLALEASPLPGVVAVVPALRSVLVEVDPLRVDADLPERIGERIDSASDQALPAGRARVIPVVYGGEHGPDLDDVAAACGLAPTEVVRRHAATDLRVWFLGFAPGFGYLGKLPPELHVPRLATPRTRTPAGSVAIAGPMTGIYPADLPGGWRIIGRTPVTLFDPHRNPPSYLLAGDVVRFEPISAEDWGERAGVAGDWA